MLELNITPSYKDLRQPQIPFVIDFNDPEYTSLKDDYMLCPANLTKRVPASADVDAKNNLPPQIIITPCTQ